MTTESDLVAVIRWAQALESMGRQQGLSALPPLSESSSVEDLLNWAAALKTAVGSFVGLPAVPTDPELDALISWARAVDASVRGFGATLPQLPE